MTNTMLASKDELLDLDFGGHEESNPQVAKSVMETMVGGKTVFPRQVQGEESGSSESYYKFRMRVGIAELELEGPAEMVREDYRNFMEFLNKLGDRIVCSAMLTESAAVTTNEQAGLSSVAGDEAWKGNSTYDRVYLVEEQKVSLNILPESQHPNSDSILLLIYGAQKFLGMSEGVPSTTLMDSAKQSGLRIDRIDRSITNDHIKLILKGGSGKGSRYSLNNRGINYVEQLLAKMFD